MKKIIPLFAAAAMALVSCNGGNGPESDGQVLFIGEDIAVVQTDAGKVRGYILKDVYTFLGIPYAAPTDSANRFMPPQPVEPWEGIKPAVFYGNDAPQYTDNKWKNEYGTFSDHWNYFDVTEDCLNLNVWTRGTDTKKRPVLVWLHGGGFSFGNCVEQDGYKGENLARDKDIVFVSVNHRLGPIGFTDFSAVDPKFADSGNAGILDIVAALKWVNRNIAAFGGDPSNVTIIGQSGGGAKVCTLVQMPQTKGLVSKGIALSGNITGAIDPGYSRDLGLYIYKKGGSDMEKLQNMPWKDYMDLAYEASREFSRTRQNGMRRGAFGPVADGVNIPAGRFYQDKAAPSNDIPMIFCSTTSESSPSKEDPVLENTDKSGAINLIARLDRISPEKAEKVYDAYENVFPGQKPIDVAVLAVNPRKAVLDAAGAKAVQDAPVYLAWFGYKSPLFDGRMRATHCSDICYWFRNTDLMLTHTGGGKDPRALSDKMSEALVTFMKTGNPNIKGLPEWPGYSPETPYTMFLGNEIMVMENPDGEGLKQLAAE